MIFLLSALHFPGIGEIVEWKAIALKGSPLEINKVVLLTWAAAIITYVLFWIAGRRAAKGTFVPRGVQNIVEIGIDFIRNEIILQTIGPNGMGWTPFLAAMFFFLLFCNLFEVLPIITFPVTARMAVPAFLALLVLVIFVVVGLKAQGLRYFKSVMVPPGVPTALKPLVAGIEFLSTFFVRPFSLAVRLFANMLSGHLLLVTFAVLTAALFTKSVLAVILPLPLAMLVLVWAFEVLIAVLQAFIFTILTAVYIGDSISPEH
jgi:F-type H+-transporting ATPase subunit a